MTATTNLGLPLMTAAQSQKHVTHNDALTDLDSVVQMAVISATLTTPPGSPSDGDRYLPGTGSTGAWSGKDSNLVTWVNGAWSFMAPREGWLCWDTANGRLLVYHSSSWLDFFTVYPTIKLNKASSGLDDSITMQTAWSTRAIFGTLGDDEFRLKVSPDGSAFYTSLRAWKDLAGRMDLRPSRRLQPMSWDVALGSSSVSAIGLAVSVTGTVSSATPASGGLFSQAPRMKVASAAGAGSSAALYGSALPAWRGNASGLGGFYLMMRGGVEVFQTNARMFMGLHDAASAIGNVNPSTLTNIIGVGFDSGDSNLSLLTNSTGATTKTGLGSSFPATASATDLYELILACEPDASSVSYRVERLNTGDVASGSISSNLPASTVFMAPQLWLNNGSTASAVTSAFVGMYLESASMLGSRGNL